MRIDEILPRRRAPVAEQARLDVFGAQRLAQQRVVEQVNLPDRQIVRGAPVCVDPREQLGGHRHAFTVISCEEVVCRRRDHHFLVGGNHPHGDPRRWRRDERRIGAVAGRIELDAEKAEPLADSRARTRRRMLADAAGEHDRVEAAQRRGIRANLLPDAVAVIATARRLAGSLASRASSSRMSPVTPEMPSRPSAVTQRVFDLVGAEPGRPRDVGHDAGIEVAGSGAHHHAADRREAHAGVDASAFTTAARLEPFPRCASTTFRRRRRFRPSPQLLEQERVRQP